MVWPGPSVSTAGLFCGQVVSNAHWPAPGLACHAHNPDLDKAHRTGLNLLLFCTQAHPCTHTSTLTHVHPCTHHAQGYSSLAQCGKKAGLGIYGMYQSPLSKHLLHTGPGGSREQTLSPLVLLCQYKAAHPFCKAGRQLGGGGVGVPGLTAEPLSRAEMGQQVH